MGPGLAFGLVCIVFSLGLSYSIAGERGTPIRVAVSGSAFSVGEQIELQVFNESNSPVFVSGCGSVQIEVLVDEHYESLPPVHCEEEGKARALPVGQSILPMIAPAELSGQTGRALVVFGMGCTPARRLSRARCSDFRTVWSANFRVKPAPG
jgi:hypothetical protein